MLKKILYWQKIEKALRRDRLTELLLDFLNGKLPAWEMYRGLRQLYMRYGDDRITIPDGVGLGRVTGRDELYEEIRDTIRRTYPRKQDLRPDLAESYVHTTVSRAVTTERMREYQKRGVQKVQVIAYIDHATTPICRSMNGRIFEIGAAAQSLKNQEPLVHKEDFWKGNKFFYNTPTKEMYQPWLPPYHYNCRTRIIPYVEPADPYEQVLDMLHNVEPLEDSQIQTVLENAKNFKFAEGELKKHFDKHKAKFKVTSEKKYMKKIKGMIFNPMNKMAVAMSGRDGRLTLYIWSPHQWMLNGQAVHNLVILSLDEKRIKTFYPKNLETIKDNFNPKLHGKIRWFTEQDVYKGDNTMVGKADVKDYEDIIDYFEWQDGSDELEIVARLRFEREWDTIAPELKERILAVDRIVLERYADLYEDDLTKRYIATIRRRLELEEGKR